jgi:hypothetical protein
MLRFVAFVAFVAFTVPCPCFGQEVGLKDYLLRLKTASGGVGYGARRRHGRR